MKGYDFSIVGENQLGPVKVPIYGKIDISAKNLDDVVHQITWPSLHQITIGATSNSSFPIPASNSEPPTVRELIEKRHYFEFEDALDKGWVKLTPEIVGLYLEKKNG